MLYNRNIVKQGSSRKVDSMGSSDTSDKKDIISGAVPPKSHKNLLLLIAGGVFLMLVGGIISWYWFGNREQLTPHQQEVKSNSIPAQEQFLNNNLDASDEGKAITLGNLAQSYASVGECAKAGSTLQEAWKITPKDLESTMQRTEQRIKAYCP